jgi:hypothetical protein
MGGSQAISKDMGVFQIFAVDFKTGGKPPTTNLFGLRFRLKRHGLVLLLMPSSSSMHTCFLTRGLCFQL